MSILKTGRQASTTFARKLRHKQTPEEQRLWFALRNRKFSQFKFRRQQPIGKYITDFMCIELKLIIEADGAHHDVDDDAMRDKFLREVGYRILRFSNFEIKNKMAFVLENIWQALYDKTFDSQNPSPAPSGHPLPTRERE